MPTSPKSYKVDHYGLTHVGMRRPNNEDQFLIATLSKSMQIQQSSDGEISPSRNIQGRLFMVADGVGGYQAGEVASRLAIESMIRYLLNHMPWHLSSREEYSEELRDKLEKGIQMCHQEVRQESERRAGEGMGTTLTLGYVLWPYLYIMHAGDSRCYLHRKGGIAQLTSDHTVATELFRKGSLTDEEARQSPLRNVLTSVIGGGKNRSLRPDFQKMKLKRGDTVLLCTDGLTNHISDEVLVENLSEEVSSKVICENLVEAANRDGGKDNITLIVAQFH